MASLAAHHSRLCTDHRWGTTTTVADAASSSWKKRCEFSPPGWRRACHTGGISVGQHRGLNGSSLHRVVALAASGLLLHFWILCAFSSLWECEGWGEFRSFGWVEFGWPRSQCQVFFRVSRIPCIVSLEVDPFRFFWCLMTIFLVFVLVNFNSLNYLKFTFSRCRNRCGWATNWFIICFTRIWIQWADRSWFGIFYIEAQK